MNMARYVLGRLFQGIATLFLASIIVFCLGRLLGNPVWLMVGEDAGPEEIAILTKNLGLDKPLTEQYVKYISNIAKGDLGESLRYRKPVIDFILICAPATLKLTGLSILFSLLIAVPAGMFGALKRDRWPDSIGKIFAILGQSVPTFWLGIVLIQIFAVQFGWLPAGGTGDFKYWILPAFTLGYSSTAGALRFTRSSMLEVLGTDYVRLARIKGLRERLV
ncbi:MAG: ABC transporter permease, partial [Thermoplasmata archaeon]|nr:ABC transporter permease [Thermoplasmata archaeon]